MGKASKRRLKEGVALLVNVNSRGARRDPKFISKLETTFGDRGPFVTSKVPSELPDLISDIRRANPTAIFVCGGDGTLRQTFTHLLSVYASTPLPQIGILRGGTMNTVATSLGIYRPPVPHLKILLDRYDRSLPFATTRRFLLNMNQQYGFIFAVGGFSNFIHMYEKNKDPNPLYAFRLLSKTTLSALLGGPLSTSLFKPFRVRLWRDEQPYLLDTEVTSVSASCIRHIGFHFKPYYGAESPDGAFGLLVFKSQPRNLLFHLPRFFRGETVSDPDILQVPALQVLLRTDEPMRPMLDGDILKATKEFLISKGPAIDLVIG